MRSIALTNQKGGVGKTTSTANLGACLAQEGRRVLLIDVDPQANLSVHFGVDIYTEEASLYTLMIGESEVQTIIRRTAVKALDLIPSNINLAGAEIELVGVVGRETILKEALHAVTSNYDYVLVDCPPSLGLLTLNALTTVHEVFIPLQTEFFALQGMSKLMETIQLVRRRLNPDLGVTGIIACMYDGRTRLAQEVRANIAEFFPDRLFKTMIHKNVKLAESPSHGVPISIYDRTSRGYKDYRALAREVLDQEGPLGAARPGMPHPPAAVVEPPPGDTESEEPRGGAL
jgi:chromosome partitioning protein